MIDRASQAVDFLDWFRRLRPEIASKVANQRKELLEELLKLELSQEEHKLFSSLLASAISDADVRIGLYAGIWGNSYASLDPARQINSGDHPGNYVGR